MFSISIVLLLTAGHRGETDNHYGQTMIPPMRLDTKDFLIDAFLYKQDKTFFLLKVIKYFVGVLQSYSNQQALQNLNFDFNRI